ncbi:cold shock domain-containing protein [Ottowia beijingensis]|uniref:Cold shock domain-containing protein n=1 Tax=Ottowia beijingensis TaxID=1207057 RepID=A0A853IU49_9BURK|nr:cold shock domain-containing protein [Ottowia beijingensis]
MTRTGHIARWNAERGFGFIATPAGEQNIFFHVRDFRGGEPAEGLAVRFEQIEVGGKGPRAMAVQPLARAAAPSPAGPARTADRAANPQRRNGRAPSSAPRGLDGQPALFAIALLAWLGLLAAISLRGAWPWDLPVVLAGLLVLNIATFFSYALDKTAAAQSLAHAREHAARAGRSRRLARGLAGAARAAAQVAQARIPGRVRAHGGTAPGRAGPAAVAQPVNPAGQRRWL